MKKTNLRLLLILNFIIFSNLIQAQCAYLDKAKEFQQKAANESSDCSQGYYQYANYYAHLCYCENEWSEEKYKELVTTINACVKIINSQYTSCGGTLSTMTISKCKGMAKSSNNLSSVGGVTQNDGKFSIYRDKIVSDKMTNFIQELAAGSNDPDLKQFAADLNIMNEVNQKVDKFNSMFNISQSESDIAYNNFLNNAVQGIAIAKFAINLFKEDEKKIELTSSQKQALTAMQKMGSNIYGIYNETKVIPYFYKYDIDDLKVINELEKSYLAYDLATASERYTLIKYFWSSKYYDVSEIQDIYQEISAMDPIEIVKKIDEWQSKADYANSMHIPNSDISLKLNKNILAIKKARCYRNIGEIDKADEIMKNVNLEVSTIDAINLMNESFEAKDYQAAMSYYPILKTNFEAEETPKTSYNDFDGFHIDFFISRTELIRLLSCGVYSYIISENYTEALNELNFLEAYISKKPNIDESDIGLVDEKEEEVILLSMQSAYFILMNEIDKARVTIDKCIELEQKLESDNYKPWVYFIKFRQYIAAKEYEKAHEFYYKFNSIFGSNEYYFIDFAEIKFQKCLMLYEQKEYDRVLKGLDMLELTDSKLKYKLLRSQVILAKENDK